MKKKPMPKWRWLLLPLTPLAWIVGFIGGAVTGWKDSKVVAECDDGDITVGDLKRWGRPPYGRKDRHEESR